MTELRKASLGDRMKSYEAVTRSVLMPHSYHVIRVDGRAFHTYLRRANKPFDTAFIVDMEAVGVALCKEIMGAVFAYGQSDEISVLMQDLEPQSQPWFGGVVQKVVSIAASLATVALVERRGFALLPQFDARVFTLPSAAEVQNYFLWRQQDAVRNSISMAAQAHFPHKTLLGLNKQELQEKLFRQRDINWNNYPVECKRGWVVSYGSSTPIDAVEGFEPLPVQHPYWRAYGAPTFHYCPAEGHDGCPDPFFPDIGVV